MLVLESKIEQKFFQYMGFSIHMQCKFQVLRLCQYDVGIATMNCMCGAITNY